MKNTNLFLFAILAGVLVSSTPRLEAQTATNVTQLIRDSQAALASQKTADAERLARRAVDLDPGYPAAWRQYGLALQRGGKTQEAQTAFQRTVSMDAKDETAWRGLALACWQAHQGDEAVRALTAYLKLKPEDAAAWRDLAAWLAELKRIEEAADALHHAVALKPDDAVAWRDLGSFDIQLKRDGPAAEALGHATQLNPDDAVAWRSLATALSHLERYGEALPALEHVTALKPDDASAWHEQAAVLLRLEKPEPAAAALERLTQLTPNDAAAWREWGAVLAQLNQIDRASAALERVTQLAPNDAAAWREWGFLLVRQNKAEPAVAALDQAVKLDPKDAAAWRELGSLHQKAGRTPEAVKAFEQSLAARPGDAAVLRDLGWALWTLNRRDEAVARLTESVEAGVDARDRVVYQVAARLSEEGASDQAIAFLHRVNPKEPLSQFALELARTGRLRAAEPILRSAWQAGEQTRDVGLYLAYARAVNSQFAQLADYLDPLLRSTPPIPSELADLAFETLRLGGTRPEAPGLVERLEAIAEKNERNFVRTTDILELSAEASRVNNAADRALPLYRRVLERDPNRACWIWAALLAERAESQTPFAWLGELEKRATLPARQAGIRGFRADRTGAAEEAVAALRQSLADDPQQPPLRQILFNRLLAQGRVAEAKAEEEWFAKRVESGETVLRSYLAEMLKQLGETRAALAQWELLRQTNPSVPYYGVENADALFRLGRADEAVDVLKAMLPLTPSRTVYEMLAEIASARAKHAEAVDWATQGLAADSSPSLLRYRAENLEALKTNAPVALDDARAFLKQDPGNVPLTLLAGRMLEATGATNEVYAFHGATLARNPWFVPSLTALRDRTTLDGRIGDAVAYARTRIAVQPRNPEALRAYANSLAQQDHFRRALTILRPLAKTPLEQATPVLVYQSVTPHPYAGRNTVGQMTRHLKRLVDDGYVFVNAFGQIAEKPSARHVMVVLIDPEPDAIEALDPILQQLGARVVYAGNADVPGLTLSGLPLPERLAPALTSGRWQLAAGGPSSFRRQPVTASGVLGNPLTHPLVIDGKAESADAFARRIDRDLAAAARTLTQQRERILVYPAGDFGHRSLDAGTNSVAVLHDAVARHFTHAVYFDDSGFCLRDPRADALRIPARTVPPEWDEAALAAYLGAGHPLTRARLELARVLYWDGQHEAAYAAFEEAKRAGADPRELTFNWGMNADRQGDLPTAREKLTQAQALDPESERIRQALERLDERRRPQATAFLSGWQDNEHRDHYRYGAYGDAYVGERLQLGVMADRDRWSTRHLGSEYGTRYGLRGLAYLAPEVWLTGSLWELSMDDLKDRWGGDLALRLPNPWLSGYVNLTASREEIETVEALRANINAETYGLRTYSRLWDVWDLFADVSEIVRSDGNDTAMLDGRLLYRLQEWPYIGVGWRFRFADSDRDPPEYWAPEQLQQHQAHISVRGAWGKLSGTLSAEAGVAKERDTNWSFVWGSRGGLDYALTPRLSLSGELGYFESPNYDRAHGRIALTGRF